MGAMEEAHRPASILRCGAWGWTEADRGAGSTEVARVLLAMMPVHRQDGDGWLDRHLTKTTWARNWIDMQDGCRWSDQILAHCAKRWQRSGYRHPSLGTKHTADLMPADLA